MPDDKARDKRILLFFNLTHVEWDKISVFQKNCCAICGKKAPLGKHLNTDHNHRSGEIRGLLCTVCNRLLGKIERQWGADVVGLLLCALNYLQDPPASKALGKKVFTFAGRLGTKRHRKALAKLKKVVL